jgi:hypothetical protein
MSRTIREIRADHAGSETLAHLVSLVDEKLELAARLKLYEYDAGEEGLSDCARAFQHAAEIEREHVQTLLELLCDHLPSLLATPHATSRSGNSGRE